MSEEQFMTATVHMAFSEALPDDQMSLRIVFPCLSNTRILYKCAEEHLLVAKARFRLMHHERLVPGRGPSPTCHEFFRGDSEPTLTIVFLLPPSCDRCTGTAVPSGVRSATGVPELTYSNWCHACLTDQREGGRRALRHWHTLVTAFLGRLRSWALEVEQGLHEVEVAMLFGQHLAMPLEDPE